MTDRQAPAAAPSNRNQIVFYLMDMVVDAAMTIGLIGIRNSGPKPLFWAALLAGLALFAVRLNGDASWWTGHISYSLLPR